MHELFDSHLFLQTYFSYMTYENDLQERILVFVVAVCRHVKTLRTNEENKIIRSQQFRSAASIGANYQEAQAGTTRPDFMNKVRIALKEARETRYWLMILDAVNDSSQTGNLDQLIKESTELTRILGSIVNKA